MSDKVDVDAVVDASGKVVEIDKTYTPSEYFEMVKLKAEKESKEHLLNLYNVVMEKLKKFMVTGQVDAAKQMYAKCIALEKETDLMDCGITTYIDRDVIDYYIDHVADECVVVIAVKDYEREIPDEIVDKMVKTKEIFDDFFIVFTDYTGEKRKKVEKERRDKDPIMFGNIFEDGKPSKKMYFIGDWIDDYCDLTLEGMVEAISKTVENQEDILGSVPNFDELDEIEKALFKGGKPLSRKKKTNTKGSTNEK